MLAIPPNCHIRQQKQTDIYNSNDTINNPSELRLVSQCALHLFDSKGAGFSSGSRCASLNNSNSELVPRDVAELHRIECSQHGGLATGF